ncbi:alpha-ketoglutarate-dependent dioxygenase alkB homolog 6-like isoform X2 [Amphibalanus amphitrite]|uniref:alpha-ketoglutarate-dependent dioxygenase alkB homolog 6-like isoform X2 n=1 Tax=Amphibalanus amphitrite TaxID=1232801 RepID=UPI001C8FB336|nr:alpha-ketoglutarate-dependent dioxygenase alkB homolog 6-like isoform X2 [Amphibalanus amphitrite]
MAPATVHYVPEFVTEAEEQRLLELVYAAPRPRWTQLAHRRLQNWGGLPHPRGMLPEQIPTWLQAPMERIAALGCFGELRPNHVLVNEYLPGQGIMPHTDGPLFAPVITTVTLGSHALLDLYRPRQDDSQEASPAEPEAVGSLLLARRSLLVVRDDAYHHLLHGIAARTEDTVTDAVLNGAEQAAGSRLQRQTRVSLTIRHVPKVLKAKLRL